MHNACIGGLGNTSILPIAMINDVFENTPFWPWGVLPYTQGSNTSVYGRILWSIRPYT